MPSIFLTQAFYETNVKDWKSQRIKHLSETYLPLSRCQDNRQNRHRRKYSQIWLEVPAAAGQRKLQAEAAAPHAIHSRGSPEAEVVHSRRRTSQTVCLRCLEARRTSAEVEPTAPSWVRGRLHSSVVLQPTCCTNIKRQLISYKLALTAPHGLNVCVVVINILE